MEKVYPKPITHKVCAKCKQDKPIENFMVKEGKYWDSYCKPCRRLMVKEWKHRNEDYYRQYKKRPEIVAKVKQWVHDAQSLTLETAFKRGQPYTEKDHKVLSNPELTLTEKATAINRSYSAVSNMCHLNGYKSNQKKRNQ